MRGVSQVCAPSVMQIPDCLFSQLVQFSRANVGFELPVPLFGISLNKPSAECLKFLWRKLLNCTFNFGHIGHELIITATIFGGYRSMPRNFARSHATEVIRYGASRLMKKRSFQHIHPHRDPQPDHAADNPRDRHAASASFTAFRDLIQPDDSKDDPQQRGDDGAARRHSDDA
jgi:hypothetical protein